jgi:hypothetical protein
MSALFADFPDFTEAAAAGCIARAGHAHFRAGFSASINGQQPDRTGQRP